MPKNKVVQNQSDNNTVNGFVYIQCPKCKFTRGLFIKNQTTMRCLECDSEIDLTKEDLIPLYLRCECGNRLNYLTNITDKMTDVECKKCGYLVPVAYNPHGNKYDTIR